MSLDPNGVIESAIAAHARANHIFHIPAGQMAAMLSAAKTKLVGQGIRLTDLSSSSSILLDAAQTGFAAVLGSVSEQQRQAQQERDREAKVAGTGAVLDAFGRPIIGAAFGVAARGDGDRGTGNSSRYDGAPGRTASITDPAFAGSLGIGGATVRGLAALGFTNPGQIQALVNDANMLGVDKNRGALALGELKRANPGAYQGHVNFFNGEYRQSRDQVRQQEQDWQRETDPGKKAEKKRKWEQSNKEHTEMYQRHRAHAKTKAERKALDGWNSLFEHNGRVGAPAHKQSYRKRISSIAEPERRRISQAQAAEREKSGARTAGARDAEADALFGTANEPAPSLATQRSVTEAARPEGPLSHRADTANQFSDKNKTREKNHKTADKSDPAPKGRSTHEGSVHARATQVQSPSIG